MTDLEKKRNKIREIIEEGLLDIIDKGVELRGDNGSYEWCINQWCGGDYAIDILDTWKEGEGRLAMDRLVNLIIY